MYTTKEEIVKLLKLNNIKSYIIFADLSVDLNYSEECSLKDIHLINVRYLMCFDNTLQDREEYKRWKMIHSLRK